MSAATCHLGTNIFRFIGYPCPYFNKQLGGENYFAPGDLRGVSGAKSATMKDDEGRTRHTVARNGRSRHSTLRRCLGDA
jgi:hypothetical protein